MATTKKTTKKTTKGKACILKPGYRYAKGGAVVKAKKKTTAKPKRKTVKKK